MAIDNAVPRAADLAAAVSLFRGLADPTRLAILQCLAGGEARVVDLTRRLSLAQSTVSGHLGCLRDCGLVAARPEGRQVFYSIAQLELTGVLSAAERLLEAAGTQVALCPTYGMTANARDAS